MSKGPGLFSNIGRQARDILTKDYNSDQKFSISTYSDTGLALVSTTVNKGGLSSGDVGAQYNYKNTLVNAKVDTQSNISTTLTVTDLLPSTKTIASFKFPDYNSGKLEVQYFHEHAAFSTAVGQNNTAMPTFYVVPSGLEKIIDYLRTRYNNKPIFVTENGMSQMSKLTREELLHDVERVKYHEDYLASLAQAIGNGADVRGYFVWTLMDDFEWMRGYSIRFGLHYVDFQALERIPKLSAKWFASFLSYNTHNNVSVIVMNASSSSDNSTSSANLKAENIGSRWRDVTPLMHLECFWRPRACDQVSIHLRSVV